NAPVIPGIVNNIVYTQYLTCETLSECEVIKDIQEEIASLTGATGASWGQITGDINDQEDLVEVFETIYDDIDDIDNTLDEYGNLINTLVGSVDGLSNSINTHTAQISSLSGS